ncbi:unnamed protein product [Thelazia callipaeda]|uniref:WD_REPEATS_REGION domain-containing protein n=1 Tax=Thelazia callipaeda TaxID=103827 RepID=A0A0N5CVQ3_THECL|nr:unnamed protein product [Thelazia callipaeda]
MDDCDGPMTYIPPSCKVSVQKVDSSVLTEPRKLCDQSTTTQHCINHGVQTDHMPTVQSTITDVKISEDVINLVLTALKANIEEQNVLARLDILHRTDFVTLSVITQFQVPQKEDLPLHSAVCGPNGRTAFLFGHHYHETWCPHNGVVVFWQRRFIDRMVLSTCPTILRYGPQGLVAIGLVTGHILIALNGECLSTKEAHTLTVTSLEWLPSLRPQLVSVSLDGKIIIHSLKSTSLEEKHFRLVTISDLPRNIKRSNSSTRYTGLTSLCLVKDKLFVGNELGAIWSVTLPDLTLSLFHYEIDCIEMLAYVSNHLLIITSFGQVSDFPIHFSNIFLFSSFSLRFYSYNCMYILLS